ncbi:MAG: 3-deoxy-D-manno-octulosonic acid transferase [Alphaproteobacteria bacterium]|nr:3-deoxy-D-manno-octulosonic acid transferase [Alphaproteobacteria bacterium]USO07417.1 MAG: 3-deoxy-D-manno-octulosonic acid transferase [Rhodospirillales bacterium]
MILRVYRTVIGHCGWLLRLVVLARLARRHEERGHAVERYGNATLPRPAGKVLWIHAASIGEMRSVLPLARLILERNADLTCLITTVTVTAARLVRDMNHPRILHQYAPFDHPAWVMRFLEHWQPAAAVWVESELWPNTLDALHARRAGVMMVNGRMSERSARRWSRVPRTIAHVLSLFDVCLAQSEADAVRLRTLGAQNVVVAGNMKYSGAPLPYDPAALETLRAQVANRPVILFASTHEGEEEICAHVLRTLNAAHPDLLGIIMPRHPSRGPQIRTMLEREGFRVAQRSLAEPPYMDMQVYLADTLGEPGLFYRLARIVFLGNSLITTPGGGHNPIEPAQLGCAVVFGPHMWNFAEIAEDLRQSRAAIRIESAGELAGVLQRLLEDDTRAASMGRTAQSFMADQNGVLGRVVLHLRRTLTSAGIAS